MVDFFTEIRPEIWNNKVVVVFKIINLNLTSPTNFSNNLIQEKNYPLGQK